MGDPVVVRYESTVSSITFAVVSNGSSHGVQNVMVIDYAPWFYCQQ